MEVESSVDQPPEATREVKFKGDGGILLTLADGMKFDIPPIVNGHHRPFSSYVKTYEHFTVLTKFEVRPSRRHRDAIT